ncbi:MAG: glycine--tRNA ligase subunit beta, partial [bacterium]
MQLLLEIGTEEIPASLLGPAAAELERRLLGLFSEHDIPVGRAERFWTPRRLAVRLSDVPAHKPAREVEVQGPPRKAAFDAEGKPTRVGQGFSAAQGRKPEDLYFKSTPRGEYVFVRKAAPAVPVAELLSAGLPGLIRTLPSPKQMRWDDHGLSFARPVRWLVCLLGEEPVPLSLDGIEAGAVTLAHRTALPRERRLASPAEYERVLLDGRVIASHDDRRARIAEELDRLAAEAGGTSVPDDELLDETAGITEFPELVRGSFRPEHLALPAEVLITALKKHQRCFSVRGPDGKLLPCFVAVTNTPGCDRAAVAAWYEKAIESRLRDARFFYDADTKRGLVPLVEDEKRVTWIEGMGTLFDKTERLRALCRFLALSVPGTDAAALDRAAFLCKADLLTDMVREKEFTSLQGRVGGIYARLAGEPEAVADAMAEHYLPNFAGDSLPSTRCGALLSIADKVDNIVATFLTGAMPSGSEDPFALRRQAGGVFAIILERNLPVDTGALTRHALGLFKDANPEHAARLPAFFLEREAQALADRSVPYDIANAVLAAFADHPLTAATSARALIEFRATPEFERLVVGQKRVANILKKERVDGDPDPALFSEPTERELWQSASAAAPGLEAAVRAGDFRAAFELLLGLRAIIDKFFDDVLVMDKDPAVRANRLR